jgi:hypothetical protein
MGYESLLIVWQYGRQEGRQFMRESFRALSPINRLTEELEMVRGMELKRGNQLQSQKKKLGVRKHQSKVNAN